MVPVGAVFALHNEVAAAAVVGVAEDTEIDERRSVKIVVAEGQAVVKREV